MKKFPFSMIVLGFAVATNHAQATPGKTVYHAAIPLTASKAAPTGPSMEEVMTL
jgi:hypothetical protein